MKITKSKYGQEPKHIDLIKSDLFARDHKSLNRNQLFYSTKSMKGLIFEALHFRKRFRFIKKLTKCGGNVEYISTVLHYFVYKNQ